MGKYQEAVDKAVKEGTAKNLTPAYKEFKKKGDFVLGLLLGVSQVPSSLGGGDYNQYLFETDEGLVKCALGLATDKEIEATVSPGKVYLVMFEGKEAISAGRTVNKFKISYIPTEQEKPVGGGDDIPF